jgi:manganese transport protein
MPPPAVTADATIGQLTAERSLGGLHRSIAVRTTGSWLRRMLAFVGPGYLVAVGYMDPGNWATDLAGGSAYGYALLWIVLLSSVMAMFLQVLAARLGIFAGVDLAQASRRYSSPRTVVWQWLLCELAICACDLAEVIGTAIALKLLFGIPLIWGVTLTVFDVLLILWLQQRGFRYLESLILSLLALVLVCFGINLVLAQPQWADVLAGFIPTSHLVSDSGMLYIAMGIIGATVMPHNLYLHSSIVQTRRFELDAAGKANAAKFATADIILALGIAFFINAAILVTSAAVFYASGHRNVAELQDAYVLLGPLTGSAIASGVFAVALLASGMSSAVTATLAGQIVMEGFVRLRMPAWARRLLTRGIAIIPALFVTWSYGDAGTAKLLVFSQVVLSLQLPFAIVPLIRFTSSRKIMGDAANHRVAVAVALVIVSLIIVLNALLIWKVLFD